MIFDACTIAESRPTLRHSSRNTELSTALAAGFTPKLMFDRPSVVWTSGCSRLSCSMAPMVSMASRRVSSCPVVTGKVRQSSRMSDSAIPHVCVRSAISRSATRTFHSRVRAWPSSSMVRATTAAPCSRTIGIIFAIRDSGPSPSS